MSFIKELKFDSRGLIPCVVQDFKTGEVLMVAYMNRRSLDMTLRTKRATFFSRSRGKLWIKGERSGNFQKVKRISIDCDGDCVLLGVEQIGGAACHTGHKSCFYRRLSGGKLKTVGKRVFDPRRVYR